MFYIVFDFMMAVIMFLFGMWFYKSEGKATKFLSGYNMKSADERKKYDENAMCKAYGKRMMFMSVPFIIGIIIDIQYQGIGCWIAWGIWLIMFVLLLIDRHAIDTISKCFFLIPFPPYQIIYNYIIALHFFLQYIKHCFLQCIFIFHYAISYI